MVGNEQQQSQLSKSRASSRARTPTCGPLTLVVSETPSHTEEQIRKKIHFFSSVFSAKFTTVSSNVNNKVSRLVEFSPKSLRFTFKNKANIFDFWIFVNSVICQSPMMYQNEPTFEIDILWDWNRGIVEISSSKLLKKWWTKLERQYWNCFFYLTLYRVTPFVQTFELLSQAEKKQRMLKLSKFTRWKLFSLKMVKSCHFVNFLSFDNRFFLLSLK